MLSLVLASALTLPFDFTAFDQAIERCDRPAVLPVFAQEMRRRSQFVSEAYAEQVRISAERQQLAAARRAAADVPALSPELANARQVMLDDRQRALDDARRLEHLRREAIELKRQFFLEHCSSVRKKAD